MSIKKVMTMFAFFTGIACATYAQGVSNDSTATAKAAPIEAQINGIDNMIYMKSTSGNDGSYTLTITFAVGTDPDLNTVNVQNRVKLAEAQLRALSPENTLARGYAIVRNQAGDIVKHSGQVQAGQFIHIKLGEGELDASVLSDTMQ